jgi:hypothetical protein
MIASALDTVAGFTEQSVMEVAKVLQNTFHERRATARPTASAQNGGHGPFPLFFEAKGK